MNDGHAVVKRHTWWRRWHRFAWTNYVIEVPVLAEITIAWCRRQGCPKVMRWSEPLPRVRTGG